MSTKLKVRIGKHVLITRGERNSGKMVIVLSWPAVVAISVIVALAALGVL